MDIKLRSKNIKVTEELDAYTRRQVEKLDRYLPYIREVSVDLEMTQFALLLSWAQLLFGVE
jgi:ribosomal subunit interface protein